jgi:hemin uptake protein HemP
MKKIQTIQLLTIALICCCSLVQAGSFSSTNYTVKRYVKPMCGNFSDSTNYNIKSTSGQDITGEMSYGQYVVEAGYWANANSNPFDLTLSVPTVAENNVSGLSIATIMTSDYDTADSHAYSLVSGDGDTDNAIFSISGSELIANVVFDYETKSSYSIRLRTTDSNFEWFEKSIMIYIENLNEAPTVEMSISNQDVDEFSEFYLNLDTGLFNDVDISDSLTYTATLSDGSPLPQWLYFNPSTLDFIGTPTKDNIGTLDIKVIATDNSSASVENTFSITINDVMENLPLISTNYRMPRYVVPMGGVISESPNFQKKATTGQDVTGLQTSTTQQLNAGYWAKANSNPAQVTISLSTISENNVSGLSIATISSLDYDANDPHTYSLVAGDGDTDNAIFEINGTDLIANDVFDFETKSSYSIRIRATDTNYGWSESIILIQIADINDVPNLSASIAGQTMNEDTSANAITFTATDAETSPCSLSITISSSDQVLFPDHLISYTCNDNSYTITASPAVNQNGLATITLTITDAGGLTATTSFDLTVTAINDMPLISTISDQTTQEDISISAIGFTVTDAETDASSLTVSVFSSDLSIVALENIAMSGTGTNQTISLTPTENAFGNLTITLAVSDGSLTATSAFELTVISVNDLPEITSILNQSIDEDTATDALSFTVTDADSVSLTLSAYSSDLALIPTENIVINGSGSNRTVVVTPTANGTGSATITLSVSDSAYTASTSFDVTVISINDPPTVAITISNQDVDEFSEFYLPLDSSYFTDVDITDSLTYTATLSDGNPLPQWLRFNPSTLVLIGTPIQENIGSIEIKVIATDNSSASVENTFSITINDVMENLPLISTNYRMPRYVVPMGGVISESPNFQKKATTGQDVTGLQTSTTQQLNAGYWAKANSNPAQVTISLSTISENNVSGLSIATISSLDYDANDPHTYSLVAGDGDTDNAIFEINGTDLIANDVFDFETKSSYSIRIRATDTNYGWSESIILIQIADINDVPNLSASIAGQTMNEDTSANAITFTATDAETSPCSLSITISSSDQVLFPDHLISYTCNDNSYTITASPAVNQNGLATITLTITDAGGLTATTSFDLTVTAINDSPTISMISDQTTLEDIAVSAIDFTITDVETDPDSLTLSVISSNLTLVAIENMAFSGTGSNKSISITPTANEYGCVTITIAVTDGDLTATSAFELTVSSVNDLPVISAIDDQSTNEDTSTDPISFTIADADGDNLTLSANSSNLTLVAVENISFSVTEAIHSVRITPTANEYGMVTITIAVTDGSLTSTSAFVLTVNSINDPPVLSAIAGQTTNEDTPINTIHFSITDQENAPCSMNLTLTSSNQSLLPDVNISSICSEDSYTITATPALNQNGIVLLTILVEDIGGLTGTTTFNLTVTSINDAPVFGAIEDQTINEDTVLAAVSITFADADGDDLTISAHSSNLTLVSIENIAFNGTTGMGTTISITPTVHEYGDVTITLAITDGILTTTTSFALTVVSVNDVPIISAISDQTTSEDTAINAINFTTTDIENAPCSMSISLTSSNQTILPNANLSYTCNEGQYTLTANPALNQNGSVGITVTVEDSGGLTSVSAFNLSITPVNDAPVLSTVLNQSTNEDTATNPIGFTVTDVDGDSLTLSADSSNITLVAIENIAFSGTGTGRTVTITPTANEFGAVSITISVSDGALTSATTFELTVNPVNDAPTLVTNIANQCIDEYAQFSLILDAASLFSDIDPGDSFTYTATLSDNNPLPDWLDFDSSTQAFSGIPPGLAVGTIDIKVTATDNFSASIDTIFSITINDTNSSGFPLKSMNYQAPRYVMPLSGSISASTSYRHKTTSGQDVIGRMSKNSKIARIGYWAKANSNPYDITLTTPTVAENNLSALTVGTLVSSDYDYADPHTYTLISGIGDTDNDIFTLNGITITTNEIFDYENKSTYSIRVRVFDSNYGWADKVIEIQVIDINEMPDISASIANHTISEDAIADSIAFTVTDPESEPCGMAITITSSNTTLFPSSSFSYTCNDNSYTITATPVLNKYGMATITILMTDAGGLTASNSFDLTVTSVEDSPVISSIPDQHIFEDTATSALNFTVTDAESDPIDLTVSAFSSNLTLVAIENIAISGTGSAKTITITPTANEYGLVTITIAATDGGLTTTSSFAVSVTPVNDTPVLSTILDQTTDEDTAINSISFTATDIEDPACSLSITITSSNQSLFPDTTISYTCNDNNYTMTANPLLNQNGFTLITIRVTDSVGLTSVTSFNLTVTAINDSPVISTISDQIIDEDCITNPLSFSITDADFDNLTLSTSSSDLSLVSGENIEISGTGANRTVVITPKINAFGTAMITISVTDGNLTDTSSFNLTVNAVNDMPMISTIGDHTTNELTSYQINYTVTDLESTNLTVTAMSSDTTLIPQNNLTITHTGENYTLSITPVMAEAGTTNITISISDGVNITETVFMLTVEEVLFQISGYVGYYFDAGTQPISNVVLSLSGKYAYSAATDSSGNYTLANVRPGSYTQTIEKTDITSGIDISDAINILKAAISLKSLSCEQIIAGDANMNDRVTPLDATKLARYLAGTISNVNDSNIRWRFIPEMIPDCSSWPPIPYSNISNLLITGDISGQDFIGILLGDVDGDWGP